MLLISQNKELIMQLSSENRTIQTVAQYLQQAVHEQWQEVFQDGLDEFRRVYEKAGEPAYAAYSRALFRPLAGQLSQFGLSLDSGLPGAFPQSIEQWGPPQERERRFWSVVRSNQGEPLGTIITRFFHDHTQLRIPQQPIMLALEEINPDAIFQTISRLE
jgi:hypothetical protein